MDTPHTATQPANRAERASARTLRLSSRIAGLAAAVVLLAGCAGVGLGGGLVSGGLVDDQVNTGKAVQEQANKAAGNLDVGRVPAAVDRCPEDADALRRVMTAVSGKSQLTSDEVRAVDSLFRAGLNCDPGITETWLDWSAR